MTSHFCYKCGEFMYGLYHKCPPEWRCLTDYGDPVTIDELLENGMEIYTDDVKKAAEKYCDKHDSKYCDYQKERKVFVMSVKDIKVYWITVYCEAVPGYTADSGIEEVEPEQEDDSE